MLYFLLLILVNLMWALLFPCYKIATGKVGPLTVAMLPILMATVLLIPVVIFTRKETNGAGAGRHVLNFVILGLSSVVASAGLAWGVKLSLASNALTIAVVSQVMAMLLFLWVIKRIELTKASLSNYLLPVFGVLLSTLTLKETVTWQLIAGGVLVFIGTFLATTYEERKRGKYAREDLQVRRQSSGSAD